MINDTKAIADGVLAEQPGFNLFGFRAMGSDVSIQYIAEQDDVFEGWVCDRISRLEHCWSRFDPTSEINSLNFSSGDASKMSQDLAMALRYAVDAWRVTDGRFDPTVGLAMNNLGYDRDWRSVERTAPLKRTPVPAPGCAAIEFIPDTNILLTPPGVKFDLGGLGKGLAADIVVNESAMYPLEGVCVSVGGDLRCSGAGLNGAPWVVQICDSQRKKLAVTRFDDGGAVATSSPNGKQFLDGRHHIIDPHTGMSAMSEISHISVIAKNCATAEIWTKAAMMLPVDHALELISGHGLSAVIVDSCGAIHTTSSTTHPIGTK
jgi:FAD:protein FMN transferase